MKKITADITLGTIVGAAVISLIRKKGSNARSFTDSQRVREAFFKKNGYSLDDLIHEITSKYCSSVFHYEKMYEKILENVNKYKDNDLILQDIFGKNTIAFPIPLFYGPYRSAPKSKELDAGIMMKPLMLPRKGEKRREELIVYISLFQDIEHGSEDEFRIQRALDLLRNTPRDIMIECQNMNILVFGGLMSNSSAIGPYIFLNLRCDQELSRELQRFKEDRDFYISFYNEVKSVVWHEMIHHLVSPSITKQRTRNLEKDDFAYGMSRVERETFGKDITNGIYRFIIQFEDAQQRMELVDILKVDIWVRKDFDPTGQLGNLITSTKKGASVYKYITQKEEDDSEWTWEDSVQYFKTNHPIVKEKSFQYWMKMIDTMLNERNFDK